MSLNLKWLLLTFTILSFGFTITLMIFSSKSSNTVNYSDSFIIQTADTRVREITKCVDRQAEFRVEQKGDFYVFYNFVRASRTFSCHESVTYTTQSDYSFLDNLPHLVERWRGPISVALYAPGDDFHPTLDSISYLRNCETPLIREFVTFHIFFISGHLPAQKNNKPLIHAYNDVYPCKNGAPYKKVVADNLYKRKHNLTYPINVARNIARQTATTHFLFCSDIELYPTPNFIEKFLRMISDHPEYEFRKNPRVYALAIFEINENQSLPPNKTTLQSMVKNKTAFLFHKRICSVCHAVPKGREWLAANETEGLHVFTVGKRTHVNKVWEAFYIGTHSDPLFDERLSWEGQSNKMPQGYSLCLMDYDYMVLDNAFLIHTPGIKKSKEQMKRFKSLVGATNRLIHKTIEPELNALYGKREGCYL